MNRTLAKREEALLANTMAELDANYREAEGFLGTAAPQPRCDVRGSAHYALGLLARDGEGDLQRAVRILGNVLDQQLLAPGEVFHGTFRRTPGEPCPPTGNYPWKRISAEARHFGDVYLERTTNAFLQGLRDDGAPEEQVLELERRLEAALTSHFPVVWRTYDPNWREFIGTTFALVLELFESRLPGELAARMDAAMVETVNASIERRLAGRYPMNTNIELMHIVLCDYFGHRFGDQRITDHAACYAADFYRRYREFHSVAEFNSPTYNGVDFCALAQWRRFGKLDIVRELGAMLEEGLWEDVAQFYNPALDNISGPFSRNYEMDMSLHTSMHALLYVGLGDGERAYPAKSREDTHNISIALCGVRIPEALKPGFLEHAGDRQVVKRFRELIERGDPDCNNPLCTATAWIERDIMLGGMAGSKNVSGQIHPATAYWRNGDKVLSLRLLRREPGNPFGKGNRSVHYTATAAKDLLDIRVDVDIQRDMELYFEIVGEGLGKAMIQPDRWQLPGLSVRVEADAPAPTVLETGDGLEVVYRSALEKGGGARSLRFRLVFAMQ